MQILRKSALVVSFSVSFFVKFECHASSIVSFCLVITLSPHYIEWFLLATEDNGLGVSVTFAYVELAILTLVLSVRCGVVVEVKHITN